MFGCVNIHSIITVVGSRVWEGGKNWKKEEKEVNDNVCALTMFTKNVIDFFVQKNFFATYIFLFFFSLISFRSIYYTC